MIISNPTTPAVLLLTAWSESTTAMDKFQFWNNRPYRDTPRSRWEAAGIAPYQRKSA